jgi:hypothetical protein
MLACKLADQGMKIPQACAQGICGELVVSRKEKRCRHPRPLSTPTGEHLRVGHVLAQSDTLKLHQTGIIALLSSDWDPFKHHRREQKKKIHLGGMRVYFHDSEIVKVTSRHVAMVFPHSGPRLFIVKSRLVRVLFVYMRERTKNTKQKISI